MQADLKVLIAELRDHVRYRYMPAACRVAMVRAADALEAVQNTTPGSGEGWRLVPVTPAAEQKAACHGEFCVDFPGRNGQPFLQIPWTMVKAIYAAMLAAAPPPPGEGGAS